MEPRRPDLLAEKIDWAADHRAELTAMGERARHRAMQFTAERFRAGVVSAVREFTAELSPAHVVPSRGGAVYAPARESTPARQ